MQFIILLLHVLVCASLIGLVLVQNGKGADIGAAFGAGASQTVFGSSGANSFLLKLTGGLAAIFFLTSIYLGYLDSQALKHKTTKVVPQNTRSIVVPGSSKSPDKSTSTKQINTIPNPQINQSKQPKNQ